MRISQNFLFIKINCFFPLQEVINVFYNIKLIGFSKDIAKVSVSSDQFGFSFKNKDQLTINRLRQKVEFEILLNHSKKHKERSIIE